MIYDLKNIQQKITQILKDINADTNFLLSFNEKEKIITIHSNNFNTCDLSTIKFALQDLENECKFKIVLSKNLTTLKIINECKNTLESYFNFFEKDLSRILKQEQHFEELNELFTQINKFQNLILKTELTIN